MPLSPFPITFWRTSYDVYKSTVLDSTALSASEALTAIYIPPPVTTVVVSDSSSISATDLATLPFTQDMRPAGPNITSVTNVSVCNNYSTGDATYTANVTVDDTQGGTYYIKIQRWHYVGTGDTWTDAVTINPGGSTTDVPVPSNEGINRYRAAYFDAFGVMQSTGWGPEFEKDMLNPCYYPI